VRLDLEPQSHDSHQHTKSHPRHTHTQTPTEQGRRVQTRQTHETFRPSLLYIERPTDPPTNQLSKQVKPPWQSPPTPTHTNQLTTTQARLGRRALRADGRSRPILLPDSSAEISGAEGRVNRGSQRWSRVAVAHTHSLTHFEIR
jgi:hypothetical protein